MSLLNHTLKRDDSGEKSCAQFAEQAKNGALSLRNVPLTSEKAATFES